MMIWHAVTGVIIDDTCILFLFLYLSLSICVFAYMNSSAQNVHAHGTRRCTVTIIFMPCLTQAPV